MCLPLSMDKKVEEIQKDPYRFKSLKKPMQNHEESARGRTFCFDI